MTDEELAKATEQLLQRAGTEAVRSQLAYELGPETYLELMKQRQAEIEARMQADYDRITKRPAQ